MSWLGRLAYLGFYAPRAQFRKIAKEGPINLWLSARGRAAMERAAHRLEPLPRTTEPAARTVYFLTGKRFWYQTVFCAYSLLRLAKEPIRISIVDDGSLGEFESIILKRILPEVEFDWAKDIVARLDQHLPAAKFPTLRSRRLAYPHLKKLTDVHAGQQGWRVVLDSDMLFHNRPTEFLDWLAAPDRPCQMIDVQSSYGYSAELLAELAGGAVPDRVNVGVCGLQSDAIDWERLEHWCRTLLEREGSNYLQEQGLTALLVSGQSRLALPEGEYIVRPTRGESRRPTVALHHYVAESKAWYFRYGWRHIV